MSNNSTSKLENPASDEKSVKDKQNPNEKKPANSPDQEIDNKAEKAQN